MKNGNLSSHRQSFLLSPTGCTTNTLFIVFWRNGGFTDRTKFQLLGWFCTVTRNISHVVTRRLSANCWIIRRNWTWRITRATLRCTSVASTATWNPPTCWSRYVRLDTAGITAVWVACSKLSEGGKKKSGKTKWARLGAGGSRRREGRWGRREGGGCGRKGKGDGGGRHGRGRNVPSPPQSPAPATVSPGSLFIAAVFFL